MDLRLQRRYWGLVKSQGHAASTVSAGLALLPSAGTSFAQTQALWRFLHNERVTLPALVEPLRAAAVAVLAERPGDEVLVVHDWCKLDFAPHASKLDQVQITHEDCWGYELTSSVLVDAESGAPLGLMEQQLRCADGVYSTRATSVQPAVAHLEQVLPTMQASSTWGLSKRAVHVIDREADSLAHLREWTADGHRVLVRVDHTRVVTWNDERRKLPEIVAALEAGQHFRFVRTIEHQGKPARQWVAETAITMHQAGRKRQGRDGPRQRIPGTPLTLRFIVAQVRADDETVLAEWLLFTNVSAVPAAKIALWYYWRWRIESFFKLLKSAGMHVEQWQQETAPAIARRLLVAAMSCLTVWHLMADDSPAAQTLKPLLIRLSGRLMKRTKPITAPALLAGLQTLLAMLALLDNIDLDDLRQLAQATLPNFFHPPTPDG
jgi:hypothetical protein